MWISTQQVNYWSYILHSSNTWEKWEYNEAVAYPGGRGCEIPKVLQNRAKLNPIVKTVKKCWI